MARHQRRTSRPRMRPGLLGAALLLVLLVGLPGAQAGADTGTYVRLAQLAPDMAGVTMTITSAGDAAQMVVLPAVGYGGLSAYQRLDPGDYVVAIRAAGSSQPAVVSSALEAQPGSAYTLAAVGTSRTTGLTIFHDDLTPPAAGSARVRVIAAAPTAPVLEVHGPAGSSIAAGLLLGHVSAYRTVAAGPLNLSVGGPATTPTPLEVPVAANQIVTVVLVSRDGQLAAQPHVDAAGPTAEPPGPVDAGYGGAADPHGPFAEILFAALAIGAGGLAAVQARRGGRLRRTRPGAC